MNREEWLKQHEHNRRMEKYAVQFREYLAKDLKGRFSLTSSYDGSCKRVKLRCNHCGFIIKNKTPLQFKQSPLCPICDPQVKQTEDSFIWRLQNLYGDQYTLLSSFINVDTFVYLYHKDCGHVIKTRPASILSGNQCNYCYGTMKLGLVDLYKRVHNLNRDLILISGYSVRDKIKVRYLSCGHIRNCLLGDIEKRPNCPVCAKKFNHRIRALNFVKGVDKYGFVSLRGRYINQNTKVKVKCNNCGYEWFTNPQPLVYGHGCPVCSSSRGEFIINNILKDSAISYEYPKKFGDLLGIGGYPLHYDFCIGDQKVLIEYQGLQHYEPIDYFGGEEKLKTQHYHDKLKRKYAKANGYNLIEIPYTCDNYKDIKKCLIKGGLKL